MLTIVLSPQPEESPGFFSDFPLLRDLWLSTRGRRFRTFFGSMSYTSAEEAKIVCEAVARSMAVSLPSVPDLSSRVPISFPQEGLGGTNRSCAEQWASYGVYFGCFGSTRKADSAACRLFSED